MTNAETVRKVVVIDRADLSAVQEQAVQAGVSLQELPSSGLEPVTTVALILIGAALAIAATEHFIDSRKGGQIIDLRPGAPKSFYRSRDVVYGLVVIVAMDGTVTVEVREPKGTFGTVIEALRQMTAGLTEATIEVVGEALRASLADDVVISAQRSDSEAKPVSDGQA